MKVKKSNVDILSPGFIENEISMKKLLKELNPIQNYPSQRVQMNK